MTSTSYNTQDVSFSLADDMVNPNAVVVSVVLDHDYVWKTGELPQVGAHVLLLNARCRKGKCGGMEAVWTCNSRIASL